MSWCVCEEYCGFYCVFDIQYIRLRFIPHLSVIIKILQFMILIITSLSSDKIYLSINMISLLTEFQQYFQYNIKIRNLITFLHQLILIKTTFYPVTIRNERFFTLINYAFYILKTATYFTGCTQLHVLLVRRVIESWSSGCRSRPKALYNPPFIQYFICYSYVYGTILEAKSRKIRVLIWNVNSMPFSVDVRMDFGTDPLLCFWNHFIHLYMRRGAIRRWFNPMTVQYFVWDSFYSYSNTRFCLLMRIIYISIVSTLCSSCSFII